MDLSQSQLELSDEYARIEQQVKDKLIDRQRRLRKKQQENQPRKETVVTSHNPMLQRQVQELTLENDHLSSYIQELCSYINQTSQKYSQNVETLTNSYKQLYLASTTQSQTYSNEILLLKNQNNIQKEALQRQADKMAEIEKEQQVRIEEIRQKEKIITDLKGEIDQKWRDSQREKEIWNGLVASMEKETSTKNITIAELQAKIQEMNTKLQTQQKQIDRLEKELINRYSLPDKIKDCQIRIGTDAATIKSLKDNLAKAEQELDYARNDLTTAQKQIEDLKLKNQSYKDSMDTHVMTKLKQYEDTWRNKSEDYNNTILKLKMQLENTQALLMNRNSHSEVMQDQVRAKQKEIDLLKKEHEMEKLEKASYLEQFRNLKKNYEKVIRSLEQALKKEQIKSWALEDEKKDLEAEVDKFRVLLEELQAVNRYDTGAREFMDYGISKLKADQPFKITKEQLDAAEIDAKKQAKAEKDNIIVQRDIKKKLQAYQMDRVYEKEREEPSDLEWDRLLEGINSIKIQPLPQF